MNLFNEYRILTRDHHSTVWVIVEICRSYFAILKLESNWYYNVCFKINYFIIISFCTCMWMNYTFYFYKKKWFYLE